VLLAGPGVGLVLGAGFPGCELLGRVPLFGLALFGVPGVVPPLGLAADGFGDSGGFVAGGDEFEGGVRDGVVVDGDTFEGDAAEGDAVDGEDDVEGCADDGEEPDDDAPPLDCAWTPAAANASAAAIVTE
jgi:hypothetical protein